MPPKKMPPPSSPVKIGLIKRPAATPTPTSRQPRVSDVQDEIENPLSESVMKVLDDMVGDTLDVVENVDIEVIDEDEGDLDFDPDDPDEEPIPSTSSAAAVPRSKRTLFEGGTDTEGTDTPLLILPGGRSKKNPIWAFFIVDDEGVGMRMQKYAKCQVPIFPGSTRLCNKRIKQGDATTSGLNSHLKSQHPTAWAKFKKAKAILERETLGAKRAIDECYDNLEGNLSQYLSLTIGNHKPKQ